MESGSDYTRFDPCGEIALINFENLRPMVGQQDDRMLDGHGAPAETRSGSARYDCKLLFVGEFEDRGDVLSAPGSDHRFRELFEHWRPVVGVRDAILLGRQYILGAEDRPQPLECAYCEHDEQDRRKREQYQRTLNDGGLSFSRESRSTTMSHTNTFTPLCTWFIVAVAMNLTGCGQNENPSTRRVEDTSVVVQTASISPRRPVPSKPIEQMNRIERTAYVKALADSGFYWCCIDPSCTTCLYEPNETCRCGDLIKSKDPVCGECFRGWKRGKGAVQGIDPSEVRRQ